jgi:hypothetical protein
VVLFSSPGLLPLQVEMSDEEYDYDYGSDAEYNYGSEEGEGNGDEGDDELIEIENAFYEGDDLKGNQPHEAIKLSEWYSFIS